MSKSGNPKSTFITMHHYPSSKNNSEVALITRCNSRGVTRLVSNACVLALLAALPVSAANIWDGGGTDSNWSTVDNWDDNLLPVFPVSLTFGGTIGLQPNNDLTGITVNGLTFLSGAGSFELGGAGITLGGDIDNASTSLQTINLPITSTAARTINSPYGDMLIKGSLSGLEYFKRGSGNLTLTGNHTFSNRMGVGNNPNSIGMTPSTHQGGGTLVLDFSATDSPVSNIIYNDRATFTTTQELRLAYGTVLLKGKNNTNNSQQIGQLGISTGFNVVDIQPGAGGKMLFNPGAIAVAGGNSGDVNKSALVNIKLPAGVQDATNGMVANSLNHASGILTPLSGNIANIVVNGSSWPTNATNALGGNIIPLPDASYTPSTGNTTGSSTQNVDMVTDTIATNHSPWTLRFNNTGTTGPRTLTNNSTSAFTIASGGILVTSGMGADDVTINGGPIRGSSNRGLFLSNYNTGGGRLIIGSNIINNGNGNTLTIGGGGSVRLNGNNSYTSGTYIFNGSTLSIASDSALGNGGGNVTVASASTTSPNVTLAVAGPSSGAWVVGTSFLGSTITGITGTAITLAGNASVDISGNTTVAFSTAPAISIDGGTLQADGTFDLRRTQPVDASGIGGSATSDRRIGLGGNGGTIEVTSGNTLTVTGAVSSQTLRGFGALRKTGSGTLVLSGNNTYSGGTTVSAGTLRAGSSTALGASGATLTLTANTTLQTNGQSVTVGGLTAHPDSIIENANATNGTLIVNSSQNIALPATLRNGAAGVLQLTKQGAGSLTLSGNNTHGGDTLLSSGTLVLASSAALQSSTLNQQVGAGSGLVFDSSVTSHAFTLGGLKNNGSPTISLQDNAVSPAAITLTIGNNNQNTSYSGAFTGLGGLVKSGNGTLTLSGLNSYAGTTVISSGILALSGNGTLGSGTVNVTGTLDLSAIDAPTYSPVSALAGSGVVNAPGKTLQINGAFTPVDSFDVTGDTTFGPAAASTFVISSLTTNDRLVVTGSLTLGGNLTITPVGVTFAAGQTFAPLYSAASVTTGLSGVTVNGLSLVNTSGVWSATASGLNYSYTESTGVLAVTSAAPTLTALETWRLAQFSTADNSGTAADTYDYDGDGLSNLLEYASGTDPKAANASPVTVGTSGSFLTLSFKRIDDPALTYTVKGRSDLVTGTWTAVVPVLTNNPTTGFTGSTPGVTETVNETVVDTVTLGSGVKRFLRLEVSY